MKSSVNSKIIILIALGILFALSPIITSNFIFNAGNNRTNSDYNDDITLDYENLKISATSGKIHIDGNSEWIVFKNDGKCTGKGTYSDPYIIKDLVIDAGGWGSCILIENSDVYFKIENCSVYNSGGSYDETYAGIQLSNVNNAMIILNDYSSNELGIFLAFSDNNTISNNSGSGMFLSYSNKNTISNNNGGGIYLSRSDNNIISNNNGGRITLYSSNNSTLSGNIMNYCGISLSGSLAEVASHIIDDTNLVNNKPVYYYVNELDLGSSNFTNAGQIILVNCNDSIISNLTVSYGTTGIALLYCNNNTISGNTVNNNAHYGIELTRSDNNTISGNTANNNKIDGITLYYSDNNTISNNNGGGIDLFFSNKNTISGNIAYNSWDGIHLSHSDYNTISGNTANNNKFEGIFLYHSNNNTISGNTANNNKFEGIYLKYSNNNIISGNNASNNECGIYLYHSNYNTISGNTFLGNDECCVEENCQGNIFSDNGSCTCGEDDGISDELIILIILISSISGGAVIGVATLLLIKRKRKRIE